MITGTQSPMVGKEEFYGFNDALDIFNISNATFVWNIWKKNKSGSWINITQKPEKMGQKVSFKFGEKVVGVEFKLQVYKSTKKLLSNEFEAKLAGEIFVIPRSAKTAKIDKVILFNQEAKDPNKASYKDSLIARAYCVAMFNQEVEFRLWEDDAAGGGHNATINKNNQLPQVFKARVNEKGIAEVKISLLSNEKVLRAIADKYLMNGDKSEGASHEFYVTASYNGRIEGASQVNVDIASPSKQPKRDSAIFPGTSNHPEKSDKEKKVTHAYFINSTGNPTNHIKVGDTVRIRIKTNNMIGEYFQYIVWEKDRIKSDDIFRSTKMKIISNSIDTSPIIITREKFNEGIDANFPGSGDPDKDQQQYFIEIIPLTSSAKSVSFGIDDETKRTKVDSGISPAVVNGKKPTEIKTTCICKEQYKDLVWGGKVSCDFRKKVVEICTKLWPAKPIEMANGLMAVMNVETWGSFKAHHREGYMSANDNPEDLTISSFHKESTKSSRAIGLIQFTQDALEGMGEFPKSTPATKGTQARYDSLNKLKLSYAQMGELNQLEKVKKYFSNIGGIESPEDIYLAVFAPKGVGKKDDYLLYAKGTDEYENNDSVDKDNNGIQRKEILARYHKSVQDGENSKVSIFSCGAGQQPPVSLNAKDIITYHIYADGRIEKHIPKVIKEEYKQKYKYTYHDDQNAVHEICIANWHTTTKKLYSKNKLYSKPKHSKVISDKNVSDGQTTRRVIYDNGDIAEYGSNDGDTFWRLYSSTSETIELVEMPESVKYVKYSFSGTKRRYTGPNYFAGFVGALAKSGLSVITTGSCFREGSCFPSQFHVNGESVDTTYFWDLKKDQKFVDAMRFFHYGEVKVGKFNGKHGAYFSSLKNVSDGGKLHNSHFHSGKFSVSKIKIIKE